MTARKFSSFLAQLDNMPKESLQTVTQHNGIKLIVAYIFQGN